MMQSILQLFPADRREFWREVAEEQNKVEEIRLRANCPVLVKKSGQEWYLNSHGKLSESMKEAYYISGEEMEALLQHICHYSLYAFEDEIKQGFITVTGGHRVGLAGQVVQGENGEVHIIKHIRFMNIRISHQIKGVGDFVLPRIYRGGRLRNVLIISPPGCGKTTLLRDLIRQISDGSRLHRGMSVGLVDERSEIAGSYLGVPQNDVGMRTDVLDACPKRLGIMMLLRSMAPSVVAVDELGGKEDMQALRTAIFGGCKVLATVHGESLEDVSGRAEMRDFLEDGLFDVFIILSKKDGRPGAWRIIDRDSRDFAENLWEEKGGSTCFDGWEAL